MRFLIEGGRVLVGVEKRWLDRSVWLREGAGWRGRRDDYCGRVGIDSSSLLDRGEQEGEMGRVLVMAGLAQVGKQRATAREGVSFSRKTRAQLESANGATSPGLIGFRWVSLPEREEHIQQSQLECQSYQKWG